jgi:hypothetical protein
MSKRVRAVMTLVATALAMVMVVPTARADTGSDEARFLSLTNSLRSSKGLGPLAVDGQLVSVARSWSGKMAAAGTISHNPSLSSQMPSGWQKAGENVGKGGNVDALQQAFQNSPAHYRNLVDPAFNYVGIGVVYGSGNMIFVTVDFMQRGGAPPAARRPTPPKAPSRARAPAPRAAPTPLPSPAPAAAPAPPPPPPPPEPSPRLLFLLERLRALDRKP